jgi:hypothetical protein
VRTRKEPNINEQAWADATTRATTDSTHMTLTRTLEVLLSGYANGKITVTQPLPTIEGKRGRHPINVDADIWKAADTRRQADDIPSMSALCEILLHAYAKGQAKVTVTATGAIGDDQEEDDEAHALAA